LGGKRRTLQTLKLPRTTTCFGKAGTIGLHAALLPEPRKRLLKHLCCPDIRRHDDAIVHPLPFPPGGHDSGTPQVGQMPGYFRLGLIQNFNEITDADFLIAHEIQEPQPRIVSQRLEEALHVETRMLHLHGSNYMRIDECVQSQYSRLNAYVPGRGK
jgi:hypothetical protein